MCGIAGIWTTKPSLRLVEAMASSLSHRGPDDAGSWMDAEAGIGLGHRRLSIVDLSAAGHQPMLSQCGRYVLCYNGEIYNHLQMRAELDASAPHGWRGHSDTETLLAGIVRWGLTETLRRAVGMFALALWDRAERRLHLARDRMGEKPLYYGWSGGRVVFGSELKALRAVPGFAPQVDPHALALFFRYNYVPTPWSIHRGIYKLPPGTILSLDQGALSSMPDAPPVAGTRGTGLTCDAYWSLAAAVEGGIGEQITDEATALARLDETLSAAVASQNVADVPVGAFLSGGVDSSLIVALMQRVASAPVRTFTVGFHEAGFDEAAHAAAVAKHLGTEHTELYVTAAESRDVVPDLATIYDEPFADSSQIPTYLVSRLARADVTVSLSGDAGDELFGGYNRHVHSRRLQQRMAPIPTLLRRSLGSAIGALPGRSWDRIGQTGGIAKLGDKAGKIGRMLRAGGGFHDVYSALVEEWHGAIPVLDAASGAIPQMATPDGLTFEEQMMFWDMKTYLPDDILTKVDRAAMRNSLETRVPFLDHRVVELAWRIAPALKLRNGQGKWILRQLLYRHVPRQLIERPKSGFGVPVGQWLRGPLRDWGETLLSDQALDRSGLLDGRAIRARWLEHVSGRRDWTASLWSALMFQAWSISDTGSNELVTSAT